MNLGFMALILSLFKNDHDGLWDGNPWKMLIDGLRTRKKDLKVNWKRLEEAEENLRKQ